MAMKNTSFSRFFTRLSEKRGARDLLLDLASIGLGIAFVPDYCLPGTSPDLFQIMLAEELPPRQLMIVHSEQLPLSPAAKKFMEYFE